MKEMFDLTNPLQEKRLNDLVKGIVAKFKPLLILCFASNLRVDASLSCFSEIRVIECCDYELLTVTESLANSEEEMQKFTSDIYRNGKIAILNLKNEDMEQAIKSKNLYISTILSDGVVLYVADGFEVQLPG